MGIEIFIQHFGSLLAKIPPLPPADREPQCAAFSCWNSSQTVPSPDSWQAVRACVHASAYGGQKLLSCVLRSPPASLRQDFPLSLELSDLARKVGPNSTTHFPWVAEALKKNYLRVCVCVHTQVLACYGVHVDVRGQPSGSWFPPSIMASGVGSQANQDFLRGPDKRTKGTLILCPCPGVDLARPA